ncbi:Acetyltransferase (GNAT) domain protein [Candidatus Gugararchaeum adminiculabundum]|nr:Acetyltransferase (GNAT) domain protein [Candidatus Gugararchaeum adminiculabundum]
MDTEILENVDAREWNDFIKRTEHGTVFQSTFWADYAREYLHAKPAYFIKRGESGKISSGLQAFVELPTKRFSGTILHAPLNFLVKLVSPFMWWSGAPLGNPGEMREILESAKSFASKKRCAIKDVAAPVQLDSEAAKIYSSLGFKAKKHATFFIDLTLGSEALAENISKKGRKAMRESEEAGVIVRLAKNKNDLRAYFELLKSHRSTLHFSTSPFVELEIQWKHLHGNGCMEIFLAEKGGRLVSAMGVWHFNGNAIEVGSANSDSKEDRQLFAGDALKWAIIKWGCENGMRSYDLGGVALEPRSGKEQHIFQFKSKWGGSYAEFFRYSLAPNFIRL